jgi:inorganic pyrophosphatase
VCVSEPTFPGCVIPVKPIALLDMEDEKGQDDKIICVPLRDPAWNTLEDLGDLGEQFQLEVAHFFSVYKQLDNKPVEIRGWHGRERALEVIEDARQLHRKQSGG